MNWKKTAGTLALLLLAGCNSNSEADLIASAKKRSAQGDVKAAVIQLKSALQENPRSGEARYLLGEALLKLGDPVAAAVELGKAESAGYNHDLVLPLLARAALESGKIKDVASLYANVALKDPAAGARLKAVVASAQSYLGDLKQAEATAAEALRLDPACLAARLVMARLLAARGESDEALKLVTEATRDDPKSTEGWHLRGDLYWIAKGDVPSATDSYQKALTAEPSYLPAHSALIMLALVQNDVASFRSRVAALKRARPNALETRFHEAEVALLDKDIKRARESIQQLLKVTPNNSRVLQLAGAIELQGGATIVAESHLQKAVQNNPALPLARRLLAETYLRMGDPEKALTVLEPMLSSSKPGAETLALAAEANLQRGDLTAAEQLLREAQQAMPADDKIGTAYALAMIARGDTNAGFTKLTTLAAASKGSTADLALISSRMRRGELDEALKAIDSLQAKQPDQPLPYLLRGRTQLAKKDLAGARASFEKALAIEPAYFSATSALAELDVAEKNPKAALARFEALRAKQPKDTKTLIALALLKRRTNAPPSEITELLRDAARYGFTEKSPHLVLVDHYLSLSNVKEALEAAQQGAAQFPNEPKMLDALGRAQLANGDRQQALTSFGKAAAALPNSPWPPLRIAEVELRNDHPSAAIKSIARALSIAPDLPAAQTALIQTGSRTGHAEEALRVARDIQKQHPKRPAGYAIEAALLSAQKRWEPAIVSLRKALDLGGTTELAIRLHSLYSVTGKEADAKRLASSWQAAHPRDAMFMVHMATIAMSQRSFDQAEAGFRAALALVPDDPRMLNNLAWVLLQQKRPEALTLAEKANQLAPDNAPFMDTLASALVAAGQPAKALEVQKRAVQRVPDDYGMRLNLAKALLAAGQRDEARTELQRLSKLGSSFQGQPEVAKLLQSL
jgi:cellulose synthase operon protein C